MRIASFLRHLFTFIIAIGLVPKTASASFDFSRLNTAASTYSGDVESLSKAVAFSILQTESRTKIPGRFTPFLETGYNINSVNDKRIYLYTDSGHSPSSFHSIYATAGVGLPFGVAASMSISQVVSEHTLTGLNASLTAQVLDFSNIVYTDLVPTLTIDVTAARTLAGPSCTVFTGQTNLGAFQRIWGMQFAYIFQMSYITLGAVSVDNTTLQMRHGAMTAVPLWGGVSLRTQVYFPDLSGTMGLGYEF